MLLNKKIILLILLVAVASSLGTAYSLGGTNIIFRTSDGITDHEVMRITSDQRVGIGTTTPQSTLDVNGIITSPTITALDNARCTNFNRYADLHGCELDDLFLSNLDLSLANLAGVNLAGANLSITNLAGANLAGANLNLANLNSANLNGANLLGITSVGCTGIPFGTPAQGTLPVCEIDP
jgi:uncharacterized protein YjbI with pentapeptide repeats